MSIFVIGVIIVVVIAVLWLIGTHNRLRRFIVTIDEAWSGIDVQLKRKANIIPNLVDTIRMQMDFEGGLLKELTEARAGLTSSNPAEQMVANDKINALMPQINAVAENYPTLGTNQSFLRLMGDVRDCEDKVAYARNRYNMTVARFNMAIVSIPTNIVANMMSLTAREMFEITEQVRKDTDDMRINSL